MKNVHDEIEKEALNQVCLKFGSLEEEIKSLHDAMFRIAEKTAEELRVKKDTTIGDIIAASGGACEPDEEDIALETGYNQAVTNQTKRASKWLGKE